MSAVIFINFKMILYVNQSLIFEVVPQPTGDRLDKSKMSELEQLRQEAEQLRNQIRVNTIFLYFSFHL